MGQQRQQRKRRPSRLEEEKRRKLEEKRRKTTRLARDSLATVLTRRLTGLGPRIVRTVQAYGRAVREGREEILEVIEETVQRLIDGAVEENAEPPTESAFVVSLGEFLDFVSMLIYDEHRERNGTAPLGQRWSGKPHEIPTEDFFIGLDDVVVLEGPETRAGTEPRDLQTTIESELRWRLRDAKFALSLEVRDNPVLFEGRDNVKALTIALAEMPRTVRRFIALELELIAMCATGEHFVDRIQSDDRRIATSAQG